MHGMPLAIVTGIDNRQNQTRNPSQRECQYWEKFKKLGDNVDASDVVIVGVRDIDPAERNIIQELGIKCITPENIKQHGIEFNANEITNRLKQCDLIFVSFDVDSLDPSISKGTGTPAQNGLSLEEATFLLRKLWQLPNLCGLEITEINPLVDSKNSMAEIVINMLKYMLS